MPTTSVTRILPAPVHDVWHVLSDIENARRWNPAWEKIEIISHQTHGAGTRFRAQVDEHSFEFEISDWVVPEFISFRPIREEDEHYAVMMESQAFRLTQVDEDVTGVELIARASTHGVKGFVMGLLFWGGHQRQGLSSALDNLEELFTPKAEGETLEEMDGEGANKVAE